ncbi:MAG: hypothetical protein EOP86_02675 [Verrucomicrobiaceae bacterium]|nr:MAG: hypothetical protein EOP86_02675 [Verrucomicrobiaceae bacterium]
MQRLISALSAACILTTGCSREKAPALPAKSPPSLEGTFVTVALSRSALGVSSLKPISRQTGTYDGVEVSVSGYVVAETGRFLVLSGVPGAGHEPHLGLHWFPLTSILSIRQSGKAKPAGPQAEAPPEPWRLEALQNLMGMVAFPLRDLPQGELELWFVKDGKKDYLDNVDTTPGFDQWLQIGIDPVSHTSVIVSVVSEEEKGFSQVSLPTGPLTPLRKTIKPGHDWLESAVIAAEGSGEGKVYARVKPKG